MTWSGEGRHRRRLRVDAFVLLEVAKKLLDAVPVGLFRPRSKAHIAEEQIDRGRDRRPRQLVDGYRCPVSAPFASIGRLRGADRCSMRVPCSV